MRIDVIIGEICSICTTKTEYEHNIRSLRNMSKMSLLLNPEVWLHVYSNTDSETYNKVKVHYAKVYDNMYFVSQIEDIIYEMEDNDDMSEYRDDLLLLIGEQLILLSEQINELKDNIEDIELLDTEGIEYNIMEELKDEEFIEELTDIISKRILKRKIEVNVKVK